MYINHELHELSLIIKGVAYSCNSFNSCNSWSKTILALTNPFNPLNSLFTSQ